MYRKMMFQLFIVSLFLLFGASCKNNKTGETGRKSDEGAREEKIDGTVPTGKEESVKKGTQPFPVLVDVKIKRGLRNIGHLGQTASWADFDNDGNLDLLLGNTDLRSTSLFLFRNTGTVFEDILSETDIYPEPVRSSAWADYDNDGYVDVLVGTIRAAYPPRLYRNVKGENFVDVTQESGLKGGGGTVRHAIWGDFDSDGLVDVFQVSHGRSYLYKNKGDGTFFDVSEKSGIYQKKEASDSAVFFDANNDGYPDLFVANAGANRFYVNNGDGTFTDMTKKAGLEGESWSTISVCTGDFNNDGFIDLYIGNIASPRNALYRNNGDGTFTDITLESGTGDVGDARTCLFFDFDNDGLLDILTTNHTASSKLYRNLGNGKFEDIARQMGVSRPVDVYAVSAGDYNGDSRVDFMLTGHLGKVLLENSGNMYTSLIVRLIGNGKTTNVSAIGSRVTLKTASSTQVREVSGGRGCCEQDMLPVHFGLGEADKVDISVRWTDGSKCDLSDIDVRKDTTVAIKQDGCELLRD